MTSAFGMLHCLEHPAHESWGTMLPDSIFSTYTTPGSTDYSRWIFLKLPLVGVLVFVQLLGMQLNNKLVTLSNEPNSKATRPLTSILPIAVGGWRVTSHGSTPPCSMQSARKSRKTFVS